MENILKFFEGIKKVKGIYTDKPDKEKISLLRANKELHLYRSNGESFIYPLVFSIQNKIVQLKDKEAINMYYAYLINAMEEQWELCTSDLIEYHVDDESLRESIKDKFNNTSEIRKLGSHYWTIYFDYLNLLDTNTDFKTIQEAYDYCNENNILEFLDEDGKLNFRDFFSENSNEGPICFLLQEKYPYKQLRKLYEDFLYFIKQSFAIAGISYDSVMERYYPDGDTFKFPDKNISRKSILSQTQIVALFQLLKDANIFKANNTTMSECASKLTGYSRNTIRQEFSNLSNLKLSCKNVEQLQGAFKKMSDNLTVKK